LIPISLIVKPINNFHISKQAAYKCSVQYLKSRIIQIRLKIKNISNTCNKLYNNLNNIYSKKVIDILNKRITKTCNIVKYKYRNNQKGKFYNLLNNKTLLLYKKHKIDIDDWIVNLSSKILNDTEKTILALDPKFQITPKD